MKTVLLLRHAKSEHPDPPVADHDRGLAERGERAAKEIGRFLAVAGLVPDLVLTSSARRAVDTARLVLEAGEMDVPVEESASLYLPDPADVVAAIRGVSERAGRLLVVGHEPAWSQAAALLAGGGNLRFPTGCLACIDLRVQRWEMTRPGCGELTWMLPPRLLEGVWDS
jgi:phosphohistidine phosphatase